MPSVDTHYRLVKGRNGLSAGTLVRINEEALGLKPDEVMVEMISSPHLTAICHREDLIRPRVRSGLTQAPNRKERRAAENQTKKGATKGDGK